MFLKHLCQILYNVLMSTNWRVRKRVYKLFQLHKCKCFSSKQLNVDIDIVFFPCLSWPGFVESHIPPIEEDAYDHEYDEVPSDEDTLDKESTPEVRELCRSQH